MCAIDGSSIRLPNEPDIIDHFGVQKGRAGQEDCPMGMASTFYDVQNNLVLDASINPKSTSERLCAEKHLKLARENDLILYDRGYSAFWFYTLHIKHNHSFCIRAKTNKDLIVKKFIKSNKREAVVTFKPNKSSIETCNEKGLPVTPITLRLVRVDLPNEVEVIITNLMDTETYGAHLFKALYYQRWGVEENYKRLKQWVEVENFSGKSTLSVKQDFYAKIVAMNLTALMVMAAQKVVSKDTEDHRLKYQVNFAQALSKMKHTIVCLIQQAHNTIVALISRTIIYISKTIEAIRPGRSSPRRLKNIKNDIHFPAYKNAL